MRAISFIFHPLLLSTYAFIIFYYTTPQLFSPVPLLMIPRLIAATFITTFAIPLFSVGMMRMTSRVSSLELTNKEERILPFISICLFYGAATYMYITKFQIAPPLSVTMIAVTALILVLFIITLRFKISIHAAANWGFCGILSALSIKMFGSSYLMILVVAFVVAGLVSASRLHLNLHSPKEIWWGSFLGFGLCFLIVLLYG